MRKSFWLALLACTLSAPAVAEECTGFKFDVSRELKLLGATHEAIAAAASPATAAKVAEGRVYEVTLTPQSDVQFAVKPEKPTMNEGSYAGMVVFTPAKDGNLRVSLSDAAWIDVLANNASLTSRDHSGNPNCKTLRKAVQFDVKASQPLVIQFSGGTHDKMRLLLTQ